MVKPTTAEARLCALARPRIQTTTLPAVASNRRMASSIVETVEARARAPRSPRSTRKARSMSPCGTVRRMKRVLLAVCLAAASFFALASGVVAVAAGGAEPPTVSSLSSLMERDLHWGMSHAEVTEVYNKIGGLFDQEYAPQL